MMPAKVLPARGFTLLEVLVALSVFAIAALALLNAQRNEITTDQHLQDKTLAHWVALNHLAELRLYHAFPEVGQNETSVSMGGRNWYITSKIQGTPSADVRLLTISVAETSPKNQSEEAATAITTLTGFLARPQSESGHAGAQP